MTHKVDQMFKKSFKKYYLEKYLILKEVYYFKKYIILYFTYFTDKK